MKSLLYCSHLSLVLPLFGRHLKHGIVAVSVHFAKTQGKIWVALKVGCMFSQFAISQNSSVNVIVSGISAGSEVVSL